MHDPYLYEDSTVLRNLLDIRQQRELESAEADYVVFRIKEVTKNPLPGNYDLEHYLQLHKFIFQDMYEWAGCPRIINIYKEEDVLGGMSVEYSDVFDILNNIRQTLKEMNEKDWKNMSSEEAASEFCSTLAALWRVHPFREGNTRTTIHFCCQYMEHIGFKINRKIFETNSTYVRTALVAYNAYFSDGANFQKKEYLEHVVKDALAQ